MARRGRDGGGARRRWTLPLLAVGAALLTPGLAAAQDATPVGRPVDVGECVVEPATGDALIYDPAVVPLQIETIADPAALPAGDPVAAEDVAAVEAVARQWVACFNGNSLPRVLGLLSDALRPAFLAVYGPAILGGVPAAPVSLVEAMPADAAAVKKSPFPDSVAEVYGARWVAENRIGLVLDLCEVAFYMELIEEAGAWRIDRLANVPSRCLLAAFAELPATPAGS